MKQMFGLFRLSSHAAARARQRGLRQQAIELVLGLHDREVPVGNGHLALSVSRARAQALRAAGLPVAVVERLARTILVVEPLGRQVVTVINAHPDSHRRYRKGDQGRPRWAWKSEAA